jgi:membrane-associated phospholipid phosphatase
MSSFAVLVVFNSGHYLSVVNPGVRNTIYSIYFILTFVLPALFIPVLYFFGMISKLEIDVRKERLLPLLTVSIMYALGWYFMSRISMPPILINIILAALVTVVASFFVTIFWKVSLHSTGIGGLLGFVFYLANVKDLSVLFMGFLIILVSGMVGTARLYLKRHSPAQIYVGYFLGFIAVYISMLIF